MVKEYLKRIKNSSETEDLAGTVESSDGVCFVPALAGLTGGYWKKVEDIQEI